MSMWETPVGPDGGDDIALTTPTNADVLGLFIFIVHKMDASELRISGGREPSRRVSYSFYRDALRRGRWPARIARGPRHRDWSA